jgi:hypothetical protein
MTTSDQAFHDAVLRKDFNFFLRRCFMTLNPGSPYLPNWHIRLIGFRLERIRRGKTKRLIINMPPRHLKSQATPCCSRRADWAWRKEGR